MTWTKLPDNFMDDCERAGLSDAAFRAHVGGLICAMRKENGGNLDKIDLRRELDCQPDDPQIRELVNVGFWRDDAGGLLIVHCMEHQPEPDLIARRREATSKRVRQHRRKKAGLPPDSSLSNDVT